MKKVLLILSFAICYLASYSQQAGTFKDPRDSKIYKTIQIGSQTWFAENLAYRPSSGHFGAYDRDNTKVATYGYLYDWETAKNVCPSGWHLPTEQEFETLLVNVSESKDINDVNIYKVLIPSGNSGFNVLYAGMALYDGTFHKFGSFAFFWTSTPGGGDDGAWGFLTGNDGTSSLSNGIKKECGSSVRCIKD